MEISQNIYSDSNKLALARKQVQSVTNSNMSASEIGDFMCKQLIDQIKKNFDQADLTKDLKKEHSNE